MPSPRGDPPAFGPSVSPVQVLIMPLADDAATIASSLIISAAARYFSRRIGGMRKDIADIVEPIAHVIGRKVIGRMKVDADQIANRVVVFRSIETTDRDSARVKRPAAVLGLEQPT